MDQSGQALPYSMFMQVVLVREGKALCPPPCAVAPAAKAGNYFPTLPYIVPNQRTKPAVRQLLSSVPSSVQSPVPGHYKIEPSGPNMLSMAEQAAERYGLIQASRASSLNSAPDPLQQVTEARLSLQALVAEYASKTQAAAVDRSKHNHCPDQAAPLSVLPDKFDQPVGDRCAEMQNLGSYPPVVDQSTNGHLPGRDSPASQFPTVEPRSADLCTPVLENSVSNQRTSLVGPAMGFASPFASTQLRDDCNEVQQAFGGQKVAATYPAGVPCAVDQTVEVHLQDSVGHEIENHQALQEACGDAGTCSGEDAVGEIDNLNVAVHLTCGNKDMGGTADEDFSHDLQTRTDKGDVSCAATSDSSDSINEGGVVGHCIVGQVVEDEVPGTVVDVPESIQLVNVDSTALCHDSPALSASQASGSDGQAKDSAMAPPDTLMLGSPVCLLPTAECNAKAQESDVSSESIAAGSTSQVDTSVVASSCADGIGDSLYSRSHGASNENGDVLGNGNNFEVTIATARDITGTAEGVQGDASFSLDAEMDDQKNSLGEIVNEEGDNGDDPLNSTFQSVKDDLQRGANQVVTETIIEAAICKPPTPDPQPILSGAGAFSEPAIRDPPTPDREAPGRQTDVNHMAASTSSSPAACDSNMSREGSGPVEELDQAEWKVKPSEHAAPARNNGPETMGLSLDDPLLFGLADAAKQPMVPPVHVNVNVANIPGAPGALLSPPKYSRVQSAWAEDGHLAPCANPLLKSGTDHSPQSRPLLKKAKGAEEVKARSRIPRLNLAPVIAGSRGDNRTQIDRPASEHHDHRPHLASRVLTKHAGKGGGQQGKAANREGRRNSIPTFQRAAHRAPGSSSFPSAGRQ